MALVDFVPENFVYFDLFRSKIVYQLGGQVHADFWARIVLRESMRDECVRQAAVAIGALAQAMFVPTESEASPLSDMTHPTNPFGHGRLNMHHRAAIRAYISAVSHCSERLRRREHERSPRSFIIITLLLLAFELLEGNMVAADGLLKNSISLLKPSMAFFQMSKETAQEEDVAELAHMLPCLSVMSGFTNLFSSQHGLLASLLVSCDGTFPDQKKDSLSTVMAFWVDFYTRNLIFVMKALHDNASCNLTVNWREAQVSKSTFLAHLQRWRTILHGCLNDSTDATAQTAIRLAQTHLVLITIFTHCCLDRTEMAFDRFEAQFRYILSRSAALHSGPEFDSKFPFTYCGHLAPPLCLAASKCRNWELRMQFIQAIRKLNRREGPWDPKTQSMGLIGLAFLEHATEGENVVVPSTSRWCWTKASWSQDRTHLVAEYAKIMPSREQVPVRTSIVLDMNGDFANIPGGRVLSRYVGSGISILD
jgi:hypothetical protein